MKTSQRHWLILALTATILWSLSKIIIKVGLEAVPPMLLAGMTQTVAFLTLLIYSFWHPIKLTRKFTNSEIHSLVWLGMLGFVLAPLLAIIGLTSVTGATAGLFASLSPLLVMLFGWVILREKLTSFQLLGVLIAFGGAYVFLSQNQFSGTNFGILLIIISEICYALNVVLTRLIMRRPGDDALLVSLGGTFLGMIILLPLGLSQDGWLSLTRGSAWPVILSIGLIFAIGGLLWTVALNELRAFEAAVLQNTMLIQVGLLSALILGERFGWGQVLGGVIVLVGAYLVNRELLNNKSRPHARH